MDGNLKRSTIFVVSEYVNPNVNSTGYYWSRIVGGLAAAFPRVAVICPDDDVLSSPNFFGDKVQIYPISPSHYKKNHLLFRLIGLLNLSGKFFFEIFKKVQRNDAVFSGTNPIFLLLCIAFAKKLIKFKWVLLVHDVFPDNLLAAGLIKKSGIPYRLLEFLFIRAYKAADELIVIGRDMERLFIEKGLVNKLTYQPNWVSKSEIIPMHKSQSLAIRNLGWTDKVIFQFFGNAGRLQGIENLLEAIQLVSDSRAAFLFIGEGSKFGSIEKFRSAHPHLPIAIISNKQLSSRSEGLAACDVAFVSLKRGMRGIGVPSKIYFTLAADRPILGVVDVDSELSTMLSEHLGVGWQCEPGNPEKLAHKIDEICKMDLSLHSGKARQLMERLYDEDQAINKYVACLDRVMGISN